MNSHTVWQSVLGEIEVSIPSSSFSAWFTQTELEIDSEKEATIIAPNIFVKAQLEKKFAGKIITGLKKNGLPVENVHFAIKTGKRSPRVTREIVKNKSDQVEELLISHDKKANPGNLNPKYTFDTFVIGNSNRFAHAACVAVAESPARAYNPLFLYGGVGLGKTHLMHAIGHHIITQKKDAKVVYVSSEKFTNELINSIKDDRNEEFRNKYRNVDILLIDDIQFIAGKERVQEEFFHTFNALYEDKKQIIISSDRPPKDIQPLEDRLRTRFEWGLIADISNPDYETRMAILKKKAQLDNIIIDDDVLVNIATHIDTNIRELEGALNKLIAYSTLSNSPITIELSNKAISDVVSHHNKVLSIEYIQEVCAKYFNVTVEDLKGSRRSADIAFARQVAMYFCRDVANLSTPKIGLAFGKRDHSTVMHGCNKIANEIKENTNTKLIVETVKNSLFAD